MGKIQIMSPELAGKIQAGEVVERPSSVVKELVENSIDANSKNITIYLGLGGLESIKIIDDGDGMDKEDIKLAFIPHATSKLKTEFDLFRILTLGFRGEAIASIAQVSKMAISSSTDGKAGYRCSYKFGHIESFEPFNSNKGTTITVEGLFLNTPARLKYLKSEKSELSSILFFVERIAMAHLDIRFTVYNNDKLVFSTSGSNKYTNLIGEIYGLDACRKVIETSYVKDGYKAHLVLLKPEIYRSNKLEITLVVNGRYVKNYNVTNAVVDAFDTFLPIGKAPVCILYFDIDPLLVDCNCHPQKTEIKLANEEALCQELKEQIRLKLNLVTLIPNRTTNSFKYEKYEKQSVFDSKLEEEIVYNKEKQIIKPELDINLGDTYFDNLSDLKPLSVEDPLITSENDNKELEEEIDRNIETSNNENVEKIPYMEYVGCVFGTYLIFQNADGMYLIDQHAAAERYNFEYYYELLGNPNQPKCDLLIPITLNLSKKEALYVEDNLDKFSNIGFTLDSIGETDFAIRTVPLWAKLDKFEDICYDILSKMIESNMVDVKYFRESIAKSVACKASIKANHQLSKIEIDAIMENLNKCKNPYTCPHGRPTIIKLTISEIEKMFERIQK